MINKELRYILETYPDDMILKMRVDGEVVDFTDESFIHTADPNYIDEDTSEEPDPHYLLFNPRIY